MKYLKLLFASCLLMYSIGSFAQETTFSGTVMESSKKQPLQGVTVKVEKSKAQVITKADGTFTIKAQPGDVLLFSFIGFFTQRVTVKLGQAVNVSLKSDETELDDVVVAMDLKRKPKELGYSVQKVTGDDIQGTQRENFINALQGRVAGLTTTPTGGQAGASTQIVLRGFNSLALDNQPLFVIDGIVADNQTLNETSNQGVALGLASDRPNRNNDYQNRIADINPNDIESVTILKGPEATALYGSQASSGAIIITTKRAKPTGKLGINYDNSFRTQIINRFPSVSNKFASGSNGVPSNSFSYFGPAYGSDVKDYDNVHSFFQTGFAQTHNLSLEYGKKNYTIRASGSLFDQDAVVPTNTYKKYNARLSGTLNIGKYIKISPSAQYIHSQNDKPLRGAGGYLLNLMIWPKDNDVRNYQTEDGKKILLYSAAPNSEFDNPFFNVHFNRSKDVIDRYILNTGIDITPFSWLTVSGRFGYDTYKQDGYTFYHPLSYLLTSGTGGSLDNYYRKYTGYNHTITATARKTVGDFSLRVMVGNMWQDYKTQQYAVTGNRLKDSVSTDSSNTDPTTRVRLNNTQRSGLPNYVQSRQSAYFGEVAIGYKGLAYLSYTHRFETSSIFPKEFRNYNYPAASLSIIMSDIFPGMKQSNILNYLKLRGSLASTARVSSPYANQSLFGFVTSSGGGFAYGFNNNNFFLQPERQKTYEIGTEMKFLHNKVSLEVSYYNTLVDKQIAENFRASYGTGYVLNTLNVGTTRNQGIELSLDVTPVNTKDFNWNIRFNFNHMWNKVLELPANVPEFYISDTWLYGNARGGLVQGGPTTSITSFGYSRNTNGDILIDPANGLPLTDGTFKVHGDRNPDFTLGTLNSFRYKNWNLSFLWDLKVGGDVFNGTDEYLTTVGKSLRTDDRKTARVVTGVLKDGYENTATPTKNTIVVTPYDAQAFYTTRMPEEAFIEHNVNWLRLRDLTLSYRVATGFTKKLRYVKSLSIFATANDLVLFTNYTGADPAVNGNTAGTRGSGGFGFDYGNIGTPISLNFGLKAGF